MFNSSSSLCLKSSTLTGGFLHGKYEENVMYDTNKAVEFLDSYITTLNDEHAQIGEYNEIKRGAKMGAKG